MRTVVVGDQYIPATMYVGALRAAAVAEVDPVVTVTSTSGSHGSGRAELEEPELHRLRLLGRLGDGLGRGSRLDERDVEQLRLLVLKTAWLMDTVGNRGAHTEIQAIKIATPKVVQDIVDRAIQAHGAAGLSQDFPLAAAFAGIGVPSTRRARLSPSTCSIARYGRPSCSPTS